MAQRPSAAASRAREQGDASGSIRPRSLPPLSPEPGELEVWHRFENIAPVRWGPGGAGGELHGSGIRVGREKRTARGPGSAGKDAAVPNVAAVGRGEEWAAATGGRGGRGRAQGRRRLRRARDRAPRRRGRAARPRRARALPARSRAPARARGRGGGLSAGSTAVKRRRRRGDASAQGAPGQRPPRPRGWARRQGPATRAPAAHPRRAGRRRAGAAHSGRPPPPRGGGAGVPRACREALGPARLPPTGGRAAPGAPPACFRRAPPRPLAPAAPRALRPAAPPAAAPLRLLLRAARRRPRPRARAPRVRAARACGDCCLPSPARARARVRSGPCQRVHAGWLRRAPGWRRARGVRGARPGAAAAVMAPIAGPKRLKGSRTLLYAAAAPGRRAARRAGRGLPRPASRGAAVPGGLGRFGRLGRSEINCDAPLAAAGALCDGPGDQPAATARGRPSRPRAPPPRSAPHPQSGPVKNVHPEHLDIEQQT
jgi:hypothetical protein